MVEKNKTVPVLYKNPTLPCLLFKNLSPSIQLKHKKVKIKD